MKLAAMAEKGFRWFFLARAITLIAGSMSPIAIAFGVLEVSNDPLALSVVMTATTVSNIVFLLVGGVVSDRLPRALVLQSCYVVNVVTLSTLAALLFTGSATVAAIAVVGGISGASLAFTLPAMQGIIPQLVTPSQLQQATAMLSFVRAATTVGGPVIAGVVVATVGPAWVFVVEAVGIAIAIPVLAMVRLPPPVRGTSSMLGDLVGGWHEFRSRTWLWVIVAAFAVLNAIHAGVWGVAGPYIAKNDPALGARGWGWVLGAEAAGTLLMTLVLMWLPLRRPLRYGMIGIAALAIPIAMIGIHPVVIPLAVAAFVGGAGLEVFSTGWNVALFENVPGDALSRVSSYDMLGSYIATPIGTMVFGWLLVHADLTSTLVVAACVFAVVSLSTLLVPAVRSMTRVSDANRHTG